LKILISLGREKNHRAPFLLWTFNELPSCAVTKNARNGILERLIGFSGILSLMFPEEEWDEDIAEQAFWSGELFDSTKSQTQTREKRKNCSQGVKETKLVSHRLRGFNRSYCASQRLLDELYGPMIHGMDILTLARICGHYLRLYLDREAFRRLSCRIKWFEENLGVVEPFLRSHVVVVDENMEFWASPDLIDQVRTFEQPPAHPKDSTKPVHRPLPRRITAFWIVDMHDCGPVCFVPDGKGGCKDGFKFTTHARRRLTNVPDSKWTNGPMNWEMEPPKAAQIARRAERRRRPKRGSFADLDLLHSFGSTVTADE
jgi:hypothetical protein